ncbi:MAG: hypothetical protein AAFQ68_14625, partial [Bacteroidota bacterium]
MMNDQSNRFKSYLKRTLSMGLVLIGSFLYSQNISDSLVHLARDSRYTDPPQALRFAKSALNNAKKDRAEANAYYQIGVLLRNASEYDSAFACFWN